MRPTKNVVAKNRPDLDALVKQVIARFKSMTPEEQRKMRAEQRKSWVIGETMLAHPEMSREQAEQLYYDIVGKE